MIPTESYNCYEYFKNNTAAFGDYDAAIHFGHRIKRSALLSDIDRLAAYFKSAVMCPPCSCRPACRASSPFMLSIK